MNFKRVCARGVATVVMITGFCALAALASTPKHTFAQELVQRTRASHPEASEIGIAVETTHGCVNLASTDPGDVGEKCEKADVTPMRTGQPVVEREGSVLDVSLPLHDASGHLVGSSGIELKPRPAESRAATVVRARAIAAGMEKQIRSKAELMAK